MIVNIKIADMVLRLVADRDIEVIEQFRPFVVSEATSPDITVSVSWNWEESDVLRSDPIGRDLLLLYYQENNWCYCQLDGADRGAIAQAKYSCDFSDVKCIINTRDFAVPQNTLHQILRMLPIRQMLLHHNVLFLHAAQVLYQNKGILFSAPSGTGKTTQAKLWNTYRNAEIICNDRTLLRKCRGKWLTYGFPYDGSEPIRSDKVGKLACIAILKQGAVDKITRLTPRKAISQLMPQTVIDVWDPESCSRAIDLIAEVFQDIPIYQLSCTVSEGAVALLEETLQKEEIHHGTSL